MFTILRSFAAALLAAVITEAASAGPIYVEPITAGSGPDSAYVQIEFLTGEAFLFEVFFDGFDVSTFDLLQTLDAEVDLTLEYIDFGGFGPFVTGLGWDGQYNSGDGSGGEDFWHFYIRDSIALPWEFAPVGVSDRIVHDGSWDAFVFGRPDLPIELIPVPAPPAGAIMLALALRPARRRRRHG
jgi:hypothetical protein